MAAAPKKPPVNTRKEHRRNSIGRLVLVGLAVILQIAWILGIALRLTRYYAAIQYVISFLAFFLVLRICESPINAAYKITWVVVILLFPLFGVTIYLLFGNRNIMSYSRKALARAEQHTRGLLPQDAAVAGRLRRQDLGLANQTRYLSAVAGFPVYQNTDVVYYGDTADALRAQLQAIRAAKRFVLMEYHAIEDCPAWRELEDVLAERAAAGVDVRILYDDMGSIGFLSYQFARRLKQRGIRCRVFNPMLPVLNIFMNHRDHRKITVVDGVVGFTGGYNLANEYFNITHPYGHWKDSGVRLTGDAVRSLTLIFFQLWDAGARTLTELEPFLAPQPWQASEHGFVAPYADTPMDGEPVGENVYMNLIKDARRYVYISTPYLIISDEMERELMLAAGRGVDVRIVTPGIPDKKMIYRITRSHYPGLLQRGVRIFEYTPGFCHQKQFVSDDRVATVGTFNLDFRSLYLHFENGCWFAGCRAVIDVRRDFERLFPLCREVTADPARKERLTSRWRRQILKILSPLL